MDHHLQKWDLPPTSDKNTYFNIHITETIYKTRVFSILKIIDYIILGYKKIEWKKDIYYWNDIHDWQSNILKKSLVMTLYITKTFKGYTRPTKWYSWKSFDIIM